MKTSVASNQINRMVAAEVEVAAPFLYDTERNGCLPVKQISMNACRIDRID